MPDILVSDGFYPVIKCGTCGTEWGYLRDQTQCTRCCRRPDMGKLRNTPKSVPPKIPKFCDTCHAVDTYWANCGDCNQLRGQKNELC